MSTRFARSPLAKKLWLVSLATTVGASFLVTAFLAFYLWTTARSDLLRHNETTAEVIAQNSTSALMFDDAAAARELIQSLARDKDVMGAALFRADATVFAAYDRGRIVEGKWQQAAHELPPEANRRIVSRYHHQHLDVIAPVHVDGQRLGTLLLQVNLESTYKRIVFFVIAIFFAGVSVLLVAMWVLPYLLKPVLAPIGELVATMREVSRNSDYSRRAATHTGDEIGELASNFNFMIEQIQQRDMALSNELTERIRAEAQLEYTAHYDSVTGLPNRHYFNRRVMELQRKHSRRDYRCTVLFIDLDNFKFVNDTFGHATGDSLLIAVAECFQQTLRTHDLVVRLGGDEFAVLIENLKSQDSAVRIAQKVLKAVSQPFFCDGHELNIGASIGVAMMPEHVARIDELLACADAAMYEAKARGKNNVQVWRADMSDRNARRFMIESGLRRAIENGELQLYYQPIIDLGNRRMAGAEALLRWKHPEVGFISPAEFIPIAEDSYLIVQLGDWVLRQACRQIQQWDAKFGQLFIAVNVSGRQFHEQGFAESIERILMETGCSPDRLELEVTETTLMTQSAEAQSILLNLTDRGFRLALDDFGTGYSSLAYLKQFPITKLKIDRSFISDLPHDLDDVAIVNAIISLSQHLGKRVVAEGIETTEQVDFLRFHDCQYGQGFLFARPMPVAEFEIFATNNLRARAGIDIEDGSFLV